MPPVTSGFKLVISETQNCSLLRRQPCEGLYSWADSVVSGDGVFAGGWEVAHAAAAKTQGAETAFSDDEFEPLALQFGHSETPQNGTAASSPSNPKVR